jgi:general secretion pathway protein H
MMAMSRSSEQRTEGGFTLIELLVAVAILALVMALSLPLVRSAPRSQALQSTVTELAAACRLVRARAIRTAAEQALTLDLAARIYQADGVTGPRVLSPHVAIRLETPEGEHLGGSAARIRFFPGGGSSGGLLVIEDGRRRASLRVDWLTGSVDVVWSR